MQRNSVPLPWYPKGCSDTLDSSQTFPGAMSALSNLIPDPSSPDLWQCRPASVQIGDITTQLLGAGFVSTFKVVGSYVYGLVNVANFDQPFCFNLLNKTFVPVTGVTVNNVPASPAATGPWVPPTMDVVGSKLMVTHPGFGATAYFIGWFDLTNPGAPIWNAGNTTGQIQFSLPPTFVAQFNGRAYYIVNLPQQPALVFSDPLNPTQITNATQVLTFGDNVFLTALGGLRLYNQAGGIIQGLIVFKGVNNMYQVTGDSALGTLAVNALNVATGTLSPLGIAPTKAGLAFISPDGMRVIDFMGNVSDPIGNDGNGITLPFIYSSQPSRIVMAASGDVVRISTPTAYQPPIFLPGPFSYEFDYEFQKATPFPSTGTQEWWYDIPRKIWSGPHTFPASLIQPYQNTFIMTPVGVMGSLWQSDPVQNTLSLFVENGVAMAWAYQTAFLPNTRKMNNVAMSYATLDMALSASVPATVASVDPNGVIFDGVTVTTPGSATIWGAFTWGSALWGAAQSALLPRQLQWHLPVVFAKMAISATGQSGSAIKIGALFMRYKLLRYLTDITAVA